MNALPGRWSVCVKGPRLRMTSLREAHASLRMTAFKSDAAEKLTPLPRVGVAGFVFVGVDFAVVFGRRTMLSVLMLRRMLRTKLSFLPLKLEV